MAEMRMTLQSKSETDQVTRRASGLEFQRRFTDGQTVLFWHTGGSVALHAYPEIADHFENATSSS